MKNPSFKVMLLSVAGVLALAGCNSPTTSTDSSGGGTRAVRSVEWIWTSGHEITDVPGFYGTKGVASADNFPGARQGAVSWSDESGDLWLFGGEGYDGTGTHGYLNDLWRFDGAEWTWVSGSPIANQTGVYGEKRVTDPDNVPGARYGAVSWRDSSGNLWLFGGEGYADAGEDGYLNDLWRFDGTNWTWVSGRNTLNQTGTYGIKGEVAADNVPGARRNAVNWRDAIGNVWLFGGRGYASADEDRYLNDLWRFDGVAWTWVSGSNETDGYGVYGTKGVAGSDNVPGARKRAVSWFGESGDLWLFGGFCRGLDGTTWPGRLNDLWSFNGAEWKWISGHDGTGEFGVYGSKRVSDADNVPGERETAVGWSDKSGNLWLFGGGGFGMSPLIGPLNDLWRFDGQEWTWVSGGDTIFEYGNYGTQGVADPNNVPGARWGSTTWSDESGNLWLFGGDDTEGTGDSGRLNDLWRFTP